MKQLKIPVNVPNVLSLFRLFSFPFVMILIFLGHYKLFTFFMWLNLTTDILDGWIARRYNQVTEEGAVLDGLADTGTYILAITGMIWYKWPDIKPDGIWFLVFILLFVAARLWSFARFGRLYGYQTYAGKAAAYVQGVFFLVLFIFGFYRWFYFVMIFSGYLVFAEAILITSIIDKPQSHIKGLYWIIRERRAGKKK